MTESESNIFGMIYIIYNNDPRLERSTYIIPFEMGICKIGKQGLLKYRYIIIIRKRNNKIGTLLRESNVRYWSTSLPPSASYFSFLPSLVPLEKSNHVCTLNPPYQKRGVCVCVLDPYICI